MTEKGVEFESVNYIAAPMSAAGLKRLFQQARLKPEEFLRTKEDSYRQYVAGRDLTDNELLAVMAKHPELIQRPIVLRGKKAVLARDIERLAELDIR